MSNRNVRGFKSKEGRLYCREKKTSEFIFLPAVISTEIVDVFDELITDTN